MVTIACTVIATWHKGARPAIDDLLARRCLRFHALLRPSRYVLAGGDNDVVRSSVETETYHEDDCFHPDRSVPPGRHRGARQCLRCQELLRAPGADPQLTHRGELP